MQTLLDGLVFPECPRWFDGALYFSDQHDCVVWRVDRTGHATRIIEVPAQPSGLGRLPDGTMLVVSMLDRRIVRGDGSMYADLRAFAQHSLNDMVVDRQGRAYVGNFGFDLDHGEEPKSTSLLRVDPDGSVHIAATEVWFPNGMAITPDEGTLILAETFAARLTAFDMAPDGSLTNRRIFADLPGIYPDGICLDRQGRVWVACAGGHKVIRVSEGGAMDAEVPIEGCQAYACGLGGEDEQALYICTAPHFHPERTKAARSGSIRLQHLT